MASNSHDLVHRVGTYDSEFEYDSESERKRKKYEDLAKKDKGKKLSKGHKREVEEEYNKEEGRIMRHKIVSMNAFDKHKMLINNYLLYYGGKTSDIQSSAKTKFKTDMDVIRENHKFLWTEDDEDDDTWAKRLAKKYYDKLFKEYCISDLSRYKEKKIAMRWRTEREVEEGKGQFICGNKKCRECEGLRSWEVNFAYIEEGNKKNALVKLRLCPDCSYKLNYHHRKKEIKPKKSKGRHKESKKQKTKKGHHNSDDDSDDDQPDKSAENIKTATEGEDQGKSEQEENIWSGPAKFVEDKSREEEFDDYFEDMFL